MGGIEIANLFARVGADVTDYDKKMQGVKTNVSAFDKVAGVVGGAVKATMVAGTLAISALATGIGTAVGKAAGLEQGIADVAASMQLGADDTAKLKDLILDLGLDPKLKVTAEEATQAVGVLGTAGISLEDILGGAARSTTLLANSTGASFGQAGAIVSDSMAQFGLSANQMTDAVNQITGVTVASKFDINDYGLAIAQAGGVAGAVGVSFEDFNATIAATSPSFASGSDAGTSFKTFLQRLVPTTSDAKEALIQLGLSTGEDVVTAFFDASGAMRPMEEIAGNLHTAFAGLSDSQRIEAASTIFGTDAMRTALALADGGSEIIQQMKDVIGNTNAEESAATRMDTLSGSWEIFTGVIETVQIGIGDKFLPIARKFTDWAGELAQAYGPKVIEWAGAFADTINNLINYLGALLKDGDYLNDWLTHLPAPLQNVILALANVGIAFKSNWDSISPIFEEWMLNIEGVWNAFKINWAYVTDANAALGQKLTVIWSAIKFLFSDAWHYLGEIASTLLPPFIAKLQEWGTATWQWIVDSVPIALRKVGEWGHMLWAWVSDNAPTWIQNLSKWATAAWEWIVKATSPALTKLGEWGGAIIRWLGSKLPDFLKTVLEWETALVKWIGDAIPQAINSLADFVHGLREKGDGDGKNSLAAMAGGWMTTLWTWIKNDLIPKVGPAFTDFIGAMLNYGQKLLGSLGNLATELGLTLWQWIVDITPTALRKLSDWGGELWGWIKEHAPNWWDHLKEWGALAWQWIRDVAIPLAVEKLADWGAALWGWIKDHAPDWWEKLKEWGAMAWRWITEIAIPEAVKKLGEWATNLKDWVTQNAPKWWEQMKAVGIEWIGKLRDGIEIAWINFTRWFFETPIGSFIGDLLNILNVKITPAYGIFDNHGQQIAYSLRQGLDKRKQELEIGGAGMGQAIQQGLQTNMNMHSPSQVMIGFGEQIGSSLAMGISNSSTVVVDAITSLADQVVSIGANMAKAMTDNVKNTIAAAAPQLTNYYQKLIQDQLAALEKLSKPTLPPALTPDQLSTTPHAPGTANPNGTNNQSSGIPLIVPETPTPGNDKYGFKDLSVALAGLTGFVDTTDTLSRIKQFADSANKFLTMPGMYDPVQASSPEGQAIKSLTGGGVDGLSVNNLLAAVQTLIRKLDERQFDGYFKIGLAPDASLQQQTELEELVTYLNALYGGTAA